MYDCVYILSSKQIQLQRAGGWEGVEGWWVTHAQEVVDSEKTVYKYHATLISRHTVVCRAAQEAGAQPREYIDRKKENAIFAPP